MEGKKELWQNYEVFKGAWRELRGKEMEEEDKEKQRRLESLKRLSGISQEENKMFKLMGRVWKKSGGRTKGNTRLNSSK